MFSSLKLHYFQISFLYKHWRLCIFECKLKERMMTIGYCKNCFKFIFIPMIYEKSIITISSEEVNIMVFFKFWKNVSWFETSKCHSILGLALLQLQHLFSVWIIYSQIRKQIVIDKLDHLSAGIWPWNLIYQMQHTPSLLRVIFH